MTGVEPKQKARWIVEAALDRKAERPIVLDMANLVFYADTFILLTGRSDRQVRAIAEGILEALRAHGDAPLGIEGMDDGVLGPDRLQRRDRPHLRSGGAEQVRPRAPVAGRAARSTSGSRAWTRIRRPSNREAGDDAADPAA